MVKTQVRPFCANYIFFTFGKHTETKGRLMNKQNKIAMTLGYSLQSSIEFLRSQNCPIDQWLQQVGLPDTLLESYDIQVPAIGWWRLLEVAADYLQMEDLGSQIDRYDKGKLLKKVYGPAFTEKHSLYNTLLKIVQLGRQQASNAGIKLISNKTGLWLEIGRNEQNNVGYPQVELLVFCFLRRIGRKCLGSKWQPSSIRTVNSIDQASYLKCFPQSIIFDKASRTAMFYSYEELGVMKELPSSFTAPASLSSQSFSQRIYEIMYSFASNGMPNKEYFENQLGLTKSKIRTRLAAENTTFREISNKVKNDLACHYLRFSKLSVIEISTILGFKNATHFSRAFRMQNNIAALDYRKLQKDNNENELGDVQ